MNLIPSVDIEQLYASIPQKSCSVSPSPNSNVTIPISLTHAVISKKSLKHVFHMEEVKRKTNSIKHKALGGYHLLNDELTDSSKVYRFSMESIAPYVCEGFVINTTEHLPVYKTFFCGLTELEMIQCFQEALQNIETIEDQGAVWSIEGKSTTISIHITSVIKKSNSELTTFYPTSNRDKASMKSFQQRTQSIYRRYYFNPCYPVPSAPDNSDVSSLHQYFGSDGIDVQLKVVHLDAKSIESYLHFGVYSYLGNVQYLQTPYMKYGLLPDSIVKTISHDFDNVHRFYRNQRLIIQRYLRWYHKKVSLCHKRLARRLQRQFDRNLKNKLGEYIWTWALVEVLPSRKVTVLRNLDRIHLPIETIQKVFFDGKTRFPSCLTKHQIIDKLKEAISNFLQLMHEDFQETKESDWEDIDLSKWTQRTEEDIVDNPMGPSWLPLERDSTGTGTDWDYFGGPVDPPAVQVSSHNRYALEMMHHRLCCHGKFGFEDIPTTIPIPDISMSSSEQKIAYLRLFSNGTCFMDTWEFIVHLDLFSGNIVDFGIVLGNKFTLNAMKPGFKYASA